MTSSLQVPERTAPAISPLRVSPPGTRQVAGEFLQGQAGLGAGTGIGFFFFLKSSFQFGNIVLLGNGGVSSLTGFSTGGEAEKDRHENATLSMPVHVIPWRYT